MVDLSELKNWIQFTQRRYLEEDVDRQWRQHNINDSDQVHWEVSLLLLVQLNVYYRSRMNSDIRHHTKNYLKNTRIKGNLNELSFATRILRQSKKICISITLVSTSELI